MDLFLTATLVEPVRRDLPGEPNEPMFSTDTPSLLAGDDYMLKHLDGELQTPRRRGGKGKATSLRGTHVRGWILFLPRLSSSRCEGTCRVSR